jgi:hypothetical protein
MKIKFPDYECFKEQQTLSSGQVDVILDLLSKKLEVINRNDELNYINIKENLTMTDYKFTFFKGHKEFVHIKLNLTFFKVDIELPVYVYYNSEGVMNQCMSTYTSKYYNQDLLELLNLNHFNDDYSILEFDLEDNNSENVIYSIIKYNDIKTPAWPENMTTLKYRFNKYHKIEFKVFENKSRSQNCATSYGIYPFEKIESEIMFLNFLKHVMKERGNVDTAFLDFNTIDFYDVNWMKTLNKSFFNNLTGEKRTAFLNYLTVIDMMTI